MIPIVLLWLAVVTFVPRVAQTYHRFSLAGNVEFFLCSAS